MTPKTHSVAQFDLKVASSFLSWGTTCDIGDEAVMKIHKKVKIGIPETGTFSAISYGLSFDSKKVLFPVEPWGMRMQWEHPFK